MEVEVAVQSPTCRVWVTWGLQRLWVENGGGGSGGGGGGGSGSGSGCFGSTLFTPNVCVTFEESAALGQSARGLLSSD
jgi:hypothetical protein